MNQRDPWGTQIGGIHAPDDSDDSDLDLLEWSGGFSLDHGDRVAEFMRRHGGPSDIASRNARMESGWPGLVRDLCCGRLRAARRVVAVRIA